VAGQTTRTDAAQVLAEHLQCLEGALLVDERSQLLKARVQLAADAVSRSAIRLVAQKGRPESRRSATTELEKAVLDEPCRPGLTKFNANRTHVC